MSEVSGMPTLQPNWLGTTRCAPLAAVGACSGVAANSNRLQAPSKSDVHLIITSPLLALLFESSTQRLTRIEVTGEAGSWVAYRGKSLKAAGAEEEEDVVKTVRRVMGPTYNSGKASGEEGEEVLSYPGVAFAVERRPGGGEYSTRSRMSLF